MVGLVIALAEWLDLLLTSSFTTACRKHLGTKENLKV